MDSEKENETRANLEVDTALGDELSTGRLCAAAWREHLRAAAAARGAQRAAAARAAREHGARGDAHAARAQWAEAERCYRAAFCGMPYGADGDDEDAEAHAAERARFGARRDAARSHAAAEAAAAIARRRAPPRAAPPDVMAARAALGVGRGDSLRDVEKAYRARARSAHPDKGGSSAAFRVVAAAFEVLKEEHERRERVDRLAARRGAPD